MQLVAFQLYLPQNNNFVSKNSSLPVRYILTYIGLPYSSVHYRRINVSAALGLGWLTVSLSIPATRSYLGHSR